MQDTQYDVPVRITIMQDGSHFGNFEPHIYSFTAVYNLGANSEFPWPGVNVMLERIFTSGNIGELQEHLRYSMSVGDIVRFEWGENQHALGAYRCDPTGWTRLAY